jgi:hypothetical protein
MHKLLAQSRKKMIYCLRPKMTPTYDDRNIEMNDVRSVFSKFTGKYKRCSYIIDRGPIAITAMVESHFKGISIYAGRLSLTHTNVGQGGGVGKIPIGPLPDFANAINMGAPQDVSPDNFQHPCSSQACGKYMAMGLQKTADDCTGSRIQFYDLSPVTGAAGANPDIRLMGSLLWDGGINGVALTKEHGTEGKYILAGIQGTNLRIYRSQSSSLERDGKLTAFDKLCDTNFPESGCGLALITQTNGDIYLVTMDGEPKATGTSPNYMSLYKLDLNSSIGYIDLSKRKDCPVTDVSPAVQIIGIFGLVILGPIIGPIMASMAAGMLNSSFRWGKGLEITSPDSFRVFASDRNSFPWDRTPFVSYVDCDFSVCVWDSDQQ